MWAEECLQVNPSLHVLHQPVEPRRPTLRPGRGPGQPTWHRPGGWCGSLGLVGQGSRSRGGAAGLLDGGSWLSGGLTLRPAARQPRPTPEPQERRSESSGLNRAGPPGSVESHSGTWNVHPARVHQAETSRARASSTRALCPGMGLAWALPGSAQVGDLQDPRIDPVMLRIQ